MSKYTDYMAAVNSEAGAVLDWRIELLSPNLELLATDDEDAAEGVVLLWQPKLGPLNFASDRVSQRSATLNVPISDDRFVPDYVGSLLHPDTGNLVRISAGLYSPTGSQFWTLATLLVFTAKATLEGDLEVQLVDRLRAAHSNMIHGFAFTEGTPVETVVARLLDEVYPTEIFTVAPTGYTMPPGSFDAGANRLELINQMVEGCGHEIVATPTGLITTRPIPPSTGDAGAEQWYYGGDNGIVIDAAERTWTIHSPQGWKVEGGSLQDTSTGISLIVYDQDPTSQGYFGTSGEVTLGQSRYPFARTANQAAVAGYAQLRRNGTGPLIVEFDTIPNPAMAEGDQVYVEIPRLRIAHTCRVIGFDLPVQVDGLMHVIARAVFDPQLNYQPPIDRNEGCLTGFSDSFDRPNENLENVPEGSGSPNWTEIGNSWGVEGNAAVQRYNGDWSLAFPNTPMCSTNHYAEVEVVQIPSGRFLGPAIRGSGAFDGYFAVADSAGVVSLEMWLDKRKVATLGSHNSGGPVTSKRLRVEAIGRTITVKLGSETIITATDDRRTGSYVGMVALGGTRPNMPTVGEFVAGNA